METVNLIYLGTLSRFLVSGFTRSRINGNTSSHLNERCNSLSVSGFTRSRINGNSSLSLSLSLMCASVSLASPEAELMETYLAILTSSI